MTTTKVNQTSINNVLDIFESIDITKTDMISQSDRLFCEKQEKSFKETIKAYKQTIQLYSGIIEQYGERKWSHKDIGYIRLSMIDKIERSVRDIKGEFVRRICVHFEEKYNITIDNIEIIDKYDDSITYQDIVSEILEQLGGLTFSEKAVQEIKDNCRNSLNNSSKIEIKNNKIAITNYVYWYTNVSGYTSLHGDLSRLFKALSYFEDKSTEFLYSFNRILEEFNSGSRYYSIFSKYDISGFNKLNSIRAYKNGKIEIVFKSNELANQFLAEYLQ